MLGFTAISYLSSTFLVLNWIAFAFGQLFSTIIVLNYFVTGFGYELNKIGPSLILLGVSCSVNAYYVELK
jgi:hypothetical protein